MAQLASFKDPFIISPAVPPGISGVLIFLLVTNTSLNIMSLTGIIMATGIVVSISILIVELAQALRKQGKAVKEAIAEASRIRLRPILMTTLATVLGLIPMALALEAGSQAYAPLARAILGGSTVSGVATVYPCRRRSADVRQKKSAAAPGWRRDVRGAEMTRRLIISAAFFFLGCASLPAQSIVSPVRANPAAGQMQQPEPHSPAHAAEREADDPGRGEAIALKNNPDISVAPLRRWWRIRTCGVVAAHRHFLTATLNITGVGADQGSRHLRRSVEQSGDLQLSRCGA